MEKSLPKGWVETKLGDVTTKPQYGWTTKSNNVGKYRYLRTTDIGKGSIDWHKVPFCQELPDDIEKYLLKENDILISRAGSIGLSYLVDGKIENSLFASYLIRFKPFIVPKFISYYLNSKDYWRTISDNAVGIAVQNINAPKLQAIPFPLPPLAEQERIVAKLDKLFAQHEKIKKALDRIPELLKAFRQQVLTQAVTGKLTEQWREGKDLEEWKNEKAQDCCLKVQSGGTPKGSKFTSSGIPFLKVYNIVNNKIDFDSEPQYVSEEIHTTQIKKSIAYPGDVIMNIVGPPLNKIAMLTNQYPEWNLNQAITIFRVKDYLNNKFLYYFFCEGTSVRSLGHDLRGVVGQANISLSQCRNFDIPIPSLQEQQEIVRRVESLFAKADAIESRYQTLKAKIDSLPQAILHKAFKGQLVPQLPTDGDAKDLLAEIMALKEETRGRKK